ncbi:MAG TPA: hypothetical protein VEA35_08605 [Ramlibacter sp.]|nr:hypothetical protein [Ramlibacter sp.]
MRARFVVLVLAILLVAGFAAQNWSEITRSSTLNFGILQSEGSMGLILLSLLGLTLLLFLASAITSRTQNLIESRQHAKALQAQRDLADRAEASRFTELRQLLDSHLRESKQRDTIQHTEFEKALSQHQKDTRTQIEQLSHVLNTRIGEMETRLETRLQRLDGGAARPQPARADVIDHGVASRPHAQVSEPTGRHPL